MTEQQITPQILHALPLRDVVIYPQMTTTILVGRKKSLAGIEEAKKLNLPIFAITQTNPDIDSFDQTNVYTYGTICTIVESIRTADGTVKVILQGLLRAKLIKVIPNDDFFTCEVEPAIESKILGENAESSDILGLIKACLEGFNKLAEFNKKIDRETLDSLSKIRSPFEIAYLVATYVNSGIKEKQEILEEGNLIKKLYKALELLKIDIEIVQAEARINKSIQEKFVKSQKEIYLSEQLKNIKKELGQDEETEVKELKEKLAKLKLPAEVRKKSENELKKLEKMNPFASEAGVVRNYLDWIASLPWSEKTKPSDNLEKAKKILDKHHYGLEKVKERILEFIAVQIKTKAAFQRYP